jgi:hypothetical protein
MLLIIKFIFMVVVVVAVEVVAAWLAKPAAAAAAADLPLLQIMDSTRRLVFHTPWVQVEQEGRIQAQHQHVPAGQEEPQLFHLYMLTAVQVVPFRLLPPPASVSAVPVA